MVDAVGQADLLGPLAGRRQEHHRRGGVGIFLQEVVFDFPDVIDAEFVAEFDLFESFVDHTAFGVCAPWPRALVFVEHAEFHGRSSLMMAVGSGDRIDSLVL